MLFFAAHKMARTFVWDDNDAKLLVLGPFSAFEMLCAWATASGWFASGADETQPHVLAGLLARLSSQRMAVQALIICFLADMSDGARRARFRRLALERLDFVVVYRL